MDPAAQPEDVRRDAARIEAPAGIVIAHIENLRAMDAWSPWVKMDPQLKVAYDGPAAGVGARFQERTSIASAWASLVDMSRPRERPNAVTP